MKGTTLAVFSTLLVISSAAVLVENDFSEIADPKPQVRNINRRLYISYLKCAKYVTLEHI